MFMNPGKRNESFAIYERGNQSTRPGECEVREVANLPGQPALFPLSPKLLQVSGAGRHSPGGRTRRQEQEKDQGESQG